MYLQEKDNNGSKIFQSLYYTRKLDRIGTGFQEETSTCTVNALSMEYIELKNSQFYSIIILTQYSCKSRTNDRSFLLMCPLCCSIFLMLLKCSHEFSFLLDLHLIIYEEQFS